MKREDAEHRALLILQAGEDTVLEDLVSAFLEVWSEGFAAGDIDGYSNGYANGYTDAGRVGQ